YTSTAGNLKFLFQITSLSNKVDNKIKELYVQSWHTNDMKLKIRFTKKVFPDFSFFKFKDKRLYKYFGNDKNISIDIDNSNILGIRNNSINPISITFIPRS
ncbi:hypothetical protein C6B38_03225, partial [Spiroplasma sp. ChiS]|uniref:hypothetical protein n=1 Tax=Spiroplasma sp. ChiS TaxID=2099885 RepID=UPI000D40B4D6